MKEESLVQRMKNKLLEEERLRNPVAQGLPWTTDVPEVHYITYLWRNLQFIMFSYIARLLKNIVTLLDQ